MGHSETHRILQNEHFFRGITKIVSSEISMAMLLTYHPLCWREGERSLAVLVWCLPRWSKCSWRLSLHYSKKYQEHCQIMITFYFWLAFIFHTFVSSSNKLSVKKLITEQKRKSFFVVVTDIKRKQNLPHIKGNSDVIGCKVMYEEGLPNTWVNAQIFSPYMRRLLVIYEFAPDPPEFPNIWGHFFISALISFLGVSQILGTVRILKLHHHERG